MDLVISFDTTGSMIPCRHEVLRRVEAFTQQLFSSIPDLRIALIAHGDYEDAYDPKTLPFTRDQKDIARFLGQEATETNGFGNGGECYEWVMHIARNLAWKSDKRAFIMIGDEPAHNHHHCIHTRRYSYDFTVPYDWKLEAQELVNNGIHCYMVRCLNREDSRKYHNDLAQLWKTPLLHLHQFADSAELITAIAYARNDREQLSEYGTTLETTGKLNRNLAQLINSLLGEDKFNVSLTQTSAQAWYNPVTRKSTKLQQGLHEVDPTRFQVLHVDHNQDIKSFVQSSGARFQIGKGFYELTKSEEVQERKEVILQDRQNGIFYTGREARDLIGLPFGTRGKVTPHNVPTGYTAFVQSTSNNRKLIGGTRFLYEVEYT